MEIGVYAVAAVLGVVFRYYMGMSQACKVIGVKHSDSDTGRGFQDAVTPPNSTNRTIVTGTSKNAPFSGVVDLESG